MRLPKSLARTMLDLVPMAEFCKQFNWQRNAPFNKVQQESSHRETGERWHDVAHAGTTTTRASRSALPAAHTHLTVLSVPFTLSLRFANTAGARSSVTEPKRMDHSTVVLIALASRVSRVSRTVVERDAGASVDTLLGEGSQRARAEQVLGGGRYHELNW